MKYVATISYNGAAYAGFQRQPHGDSIQNEIESVLTELCGKKTLLKASGRTDKGVHALGQVIMFDSKQIKDLEHFRYAFNRLIPKDIMMLSLKEAPLSFDPRHSSNGKVYEYRFRLNERNVEEVNRVSFFEMQGFDLNLFKEALSKFVGVHNFKNFTTKPEDNEGFNREIRYIKVEEKGKDLYSVYLEANHFMRYMVRMIIGTSVKVAYKKLDIKVIDDLLSNQASKALTYKAPSDGLYLVEVKYAIS